MPFVISFELEICPRLLQPRQDCLSPLFALDGREKLLQPSAVRGKGFVRADEMLFGKIALIEQKSCLSASSFHFHKSPPHGVCG